ncbi:MAG: 1-acyl-sn-glycerol-3-phosphate acyltransferase, partial [candidate division Zixibacteria bacterium]|nr:1-acyl-sn-glycerol-3-phosphate acyltransferase [candidate division Zixibacteria bacterium]
MRLIYRLGWLAARLTSALIFRSKVTGREFLPTAGGFILASNHISYYDPPLVGSYISRNMYYFGKRELFKQPIIGAILRKVNTLPVRRG